MTSEQKIIRAKIRLLKLADKLGSVTDACRKMGYSRDSFYRFKKLYESGGEPGLARVSRRTPLLKNRVAHEIEDAVIAFAREHPSFGHVKVARELRKRGIKVSAGGVRSVWLRHNLETAEKRLNALGTKPNRARSSLVSSGVDEAL